MARRSLIATFGVMLLVTSRHAHADLVPAPTMACPRGGVGETSHSGRWCDARSCKSDADCKFVWGPNGPTQGTCETTSLCVRTEHVRKHDTALATDGAPYTFEKRVAVKECTRGATCDDGSPCAIALRCVGPTEARDASIPEVRDASLPTPEPQAPEMRPGRGCGCGKTSGPKASSLVGGLLVLWLVRRRR